MIEFVKKNYRQMLQLFMIVKFNERYEYYMIFSEEECIGYVVVDGKELFPKFFTTEKDVISRCTQQMKYRFSES